LIILLFIGLRSTSIFFLIAFVVNILLGWLAVVFVGLALRGTLGEQVVLLYRLLLATFATSGAL